MNKLLLFITLLIIYIIIILLIKLSTYYFINKNFSFKGILKYLTGFFSIDYLLTKILKNKVKEIEYNKNERLAILIKSYNIINIIISAVLLLIVVVLKMFEVKGSIFNIDLYLIIEIFIIIRFISRSIEIIISFVLDVIDDKKESTLNNKERIILAFISILEICITFSLIIILSLGFDGLNNTFIGMLEFIDCKELTLLGYEKVIYNYYTVVLYIMYSFVIVNYIQDFNENKKNKDNKQ